MHACRTRATKRRDKQYEATLFLRSEQRRLRAGRPPPQAASGAPQPPPNDGQRTEMRASADVLAREAAQRRKPWPERNLPVLPPAHVAAAARGTSVPRAVAYSAEDAARHSAAGSRQELRPLDVLSLKVGYSRDAEYALPDEVRSRARRDKDIAITELCHNLTVRE